MSKVAESIVVMESYDVHVIASLKRSGGVLLVRNSYVEGDDGHASYVPPADMYMSPDGARRLRDKLNEWFPKEQDPPPKEK